MSRTIKASGYRPELKEFRRARAATMTARELKALIRECVNECAGGKR